MASMTKHIPVHKNMTGNCGQYAEEEAPASEGERETVGKPTGKVPDMQNVWDVTETVTEERVVEEIPPNTWEQILQCLSTERHEMTGESSNCTGKVWPRCDKTVTPRSRSDQEDEEDEENSSEVSQRADQMEYIKEFQEVMNQAIEQLLKKSARRHPCQKDKPEPHMEQGEHKETICKKQKCFHQEMSAESLVMSETVGVSLETMDTDRCIQKLVRTEPEGSEHAQRKIEKTVQYWVAQEKEAAMNYHHALK